MLQIINKQINSLKIPNETSHLLYLYSLELDGKLCVKPGITSQNLSERIYKYLFVEHKNQTKNMDTFMLLAVYNFDSINVAKSAESFVKEGLKKYPLHIKQHHLTEQYCLKSSWNALSPLVNNTFPFCANHWIHSNINNKVNDIIENYNSDQIIKKKEIFENKIYALNEQIIKILENYTLNEQNNEIIKNKVNSASEQCKSTSISKWENKYENIINGEKIYGIGPVTIDAIQYVNKNCVLNRESMGIFCNDLKKEMMAYNRTKGKKSHYNVVIKYIMNE